MELCVYDINLKHILIEGLNTRLIDCVLEGFFLHSSREDKRRKKIPNNLTEMKNHEKVPEKPEIIYAISI